VSATLFATAASNRVDLMTASSHAFTLESELGGGTGLTSAPLEGKATGDVLTAAEYNRVLEVLSEGGSGT